MPARTQMPFDLWTLEIFLAVCEGGTMASAARLLGLTQPAVSLVIADMERELKVTLFDRATRPIALTSTGALLRQHASSIISEARHAAAQMQNARRGRLSSIRIGLVRSLVRLLSVPLIQTLKGAADQLFVDCDASAVHAQGLRTRQLDLFVGADDLADEVGLERWPIVREPYVLFAPAALGSADLAQLAERHPFVQFGARSNSATEIRRYLQRLGVEPQCGLHFSGADGLASIVLAGLGWTITTPLCLIEAGIELEPDCVHRLPGPGLQRTLTLVSRHRELASVPRVVAEMAADVLRRECDRQMATLGPARPAPMAFGAEISQPLRSVQLMGARRFAPAPAAAGVSGDS